MYTPAAAAASGTGGDFQGEAVPVFHFPQLCHRSMDAIKAGFQKQPQRTSAPAFL